MNSVLVKKRLCMQSVGIGSTNREHLLICVERIVSAVKNVLVTTGVRMLVGDVDGTTIIGRVFVAGDG